MIIAKREPFTKEETEKLRNETKVILASLAMDLKRVALGYHRGSIPMARRFLQEALKRAGEIDKITLKKHLREMLFDIEKMKFEKDHQRIAEDALMYSILFQNAALAS